MQITIPDQEDADIDWFATDSNGHILHVASGGGILPESVAASQEALLALHQYFLTLPEAAAADAILLEVHAEKGVSYQSFVRYACRGLFSFDKTVLNNHSDTQYHVVAKPVHALTVAGLPTHIAELLNRTKLADSITHQSTLDISIVFYQWIGFVAASYITPPYLMWLKLFPMG